MCPGASSTSFSEAGPRRRRLLLGACLLLGGCGFRPLYSDATRTATGSTVAEALATTRVAVIADRQGQMLRNALNDRLGNRSGLPAKHELRVTLAITRELLGVRRDETASRGRLNANATFTLAELPSGAPVVTGRSFAVDAFNIVPNEFFAAQLSGEAAEARLAERLAEDIVSQLAAFYARSVARS